MATSTPKKPAEDAPAPEQRRPSPAESTDPTVHHLLAQRQILLMNIEDAQAKQHIIDDAQQRLAVVDAQLADLGY